MTKQTPNAISPIPSQKIRIISQGSTSSADVPWFSEVDPSAIFSGSDMANSGRKSVRELIKAIQQDSAQVVVDSGPGFRICAT